MITVDARGDQCPIPVIKTKKAIEALAGPETVEVFVDNETAVGNVTRLAGSLGAAVTSEKLAEKNYPRMVQDFRKRYRAKAVAQILYDFVSADSFGWKAWMEATARHREKLLNG